MSPDSGPPRSTSAASSSGADEGSLRTSLSRTNDAPRSPEELEAALREARGRVSRHIEELRAEVSVPRLRARERVREHPVAAVVGAVVLGWLAGRMLKGRSGGEAPPAKDVLENVLREARARSREGELDERAIEEIRDRYVAAMETVRSERDSGGSGAGTGLVGSVVRSLAGRVVREGVERILPQLIGRLEERFRTGGPEATGATGEASADGSPPGNGPEG